MSRPRKPAVQKPETSAETTSVAPPQKAAGAPNPAAPPQPETTGAASQPASAAAEAAAAPVDPKPEMTTRPPAPTASRLIVKGPAKGRWRAGRHFVAVEVEIPVAELTEVQIALLEGDPELTVTRSD